MNATCICVWARVRPYVNALDHNTQQKNDCEERIGMDPDGILVICFDLLRIFFCWGGGGKGGEESEKTRENPSKAVRYLLCGITLQEKRAAWQDRFVVLYGIMTGSRDDSPSRTRLKGRQQCSQQTKCAGIWEVHCLFRCPTKYVVSWFPKIQHSVQNSLHLHPMLSHFCLNIRTPLLC